MTKNRDPWCKQKLRVVIIFCHERQRQWPWPWMKYHVWYTIPCNLTIWQAIWRCLPSSEDLQTSFLSFVLLGKANDKIEWEHPPTQVKVAKYHQHYHCHPNARVAKCHGYVGYIRLKRLSSWGKKFGRTKKLAKTSHFWEYLCKKFKIQWTNYHEWIVYPHLFITRTLLSSVL